MGLSRGFRSRTLFPWGTSMETSVVIPQLIRGIPTMPRLDFRGASIVLQSCHSAYIFHWGSVMLSWCFCGVFMVLLVLSLCSHAASMEASCYHGTSTVLPWDFHGASMALP